MSDLHALREKIAARYIHPPIGRPIDADEVHHKYGQPTIDRNLLVISGRNHATTEALAIIDAEIAAHERECSLGHEKIARAAEIAESYKRQLRESLDREAERFAENLCLRFERGTHNRLQFAPSPTPKRSDRHARKLRLASILAGVAVAGAVALGVVGAARVTRWLDEAPNECVAALWGWWSL